MTIEQEKKAKHQAEMSRKEKELFKQQTTSALHQAEMSKAQE